MNFKLPCFALDTSVEYQKIQNGVKMADILRYEPRTVKPSVLQIIEAKSSAPQCGTHPEMDLDTYIQPVSDKFLNAIQFVASALLNRRPDFKKTLESSVGAIDIQNATIIFILVVREFRRPDEAQNLRDALYPGLRAVLRVWNPHADLLVLDHAGAQKQGLCA